MENEKELPKTQSSPEDVMLESAAWSVESAILPPHTKLRGHTHAEAHICLVVDGGFVERWRGRDRACGPGTLRISRAHVDHLIATASSTASCLVVEFPSERLLEYERPMQLDRDPSRFLDIPRSIFNNRQTLPIPASDDLSLECWVSEVLAQVARQDRMGRESEPPTWLTRVRDRLEDGFREPVTLQELADFAGVHSSHLARAFREHYGSTIGEFSRNRRLRFARRRIEDSDDSIAEIAFAAGFADQAHLTRAFTQRWGSPPARFRRLRTARGIRS